MSGPLLKSSLLLPTDQQLGWLAVGQTFGQSVGGQLARSKAASTEDAFRKVLNFRESETFFLFLGRFVVKKETF